MLAAAAAQDQQQQQLPDITALAQTAMDWVRHADVVAAAKCEAALERLCRRRAECTADALRSAVARLRAKLKAAKADAEAMRKAATAGAVAAVESASAKEEAARAQADLATAREALRAARAENGRLGRQRAAAATAAAAAAAAAGGNSVQSGLAGLDIAALLGGAVAGGAGNASAAQYAGVDDAAGLERLTGVLVLLQRELAGQQSAKEGLESKLKESKSSIDRKNVLIRCKLWRGASSRCVVELKYSTHARVGLMLVMVCHARSQRWIRTLPGTSTHIAILLKSECCSTSSTATCCYMSVQTSQMHTNVYLRSALRELKARVEDLSSRLASNPTAVLEDCLQCCLTFLVLRAAPAAL
jgi:hypothetical protein